MTGALDGKALPMPTGQGLAQVTRGSLLIGYCVATIFFLGFGAWAAFVPLSGAAMAPGVVSPDGYRKTVQHLEGGIVQAIFVHDGQDVRKGEELIALQNTQALADYNELRKRLLQLRAAEARLVAEQEGASSISYPPDLRTAGPVAAAAMADQTALFRSRRATLDGRERILHQRIAQLREANRGLRGVISAQDEKSALIKREIVAVRKLYAKGLARLPRLLELERAQADIRAERARRTAGIAGNNQKIGETEIQRITIYEEDRGTVGKELAKVRADLAVARSRLPSRADVLRRTLVRAPVSGRVMNVRVTTEVGGVLKSGEPILDIVPENGRLVIDARVKPVDIDTVKSGMKTRVLLTAYRQRSMPQIYGRVRTVSADRLVDEKTGQPYFLAEVEVPPGELKRDGRDIRLMPGMPAEIMILTGERTLMDYLLQPLVESFMRSFRES